MKYFDIEFYDINDVKWNVIAKLWQDKLINDIEFQWQENTWCSSINVKTKFVELYNDLWVSEWNVIKVRLYDNVNNINWDIIYIWYLYSALIERDLKKWLRSDVLTLKCSHWVSLCKRVTTTINWNNTLKWHIDWLLSVLNFNFPWLFTLWRIDRFLSSSNVDLPFAINWTVESVFDYFLSISQATGFMFFLSPDLKINFRARTFLPENWSNISSQSWDSILSQSWDNIVLQSEWENNFDSDFVINEWTMINKLSKNLDILSIVNRVIVVFSYEFPSSTWQPIQAQKTYTIDDANSISKYWVLSKYYDESSYVFWLEEFADAWAITFAQNIFNQSNSLSDVFEIELNNTFFIYQLKVGDFITIINTDFDIKQKQVTAITYSPTRPKITVWKVVSIWKAILWQ